MIKRTCHVLYMTAGSIAAIFLSIMMVVLAVQVFSRYVMNNALTWAEELIRYLEVWLVFLGASMCVKDDTHPTVTIFTNLFPKALRFPVKVFVNIAVGAVGVVMMVVGSQFAARYVGQLTPTMRISIAYVYAAIPVSGFLICAQTIGNFADLLHKRLAETEEAVL